MYNIILIPKPGKPGKVRRIYIPDPELMRKLRAAVPMLNLNAESRDIYKVQHGFTEGRSPLTNAKVHIGYEYTVCFDLSDFFDTVTEKMVRALAKNHDADMLGDLPVSAYFPDGATRQGLPTSPALANIAASPMDRVFVERFCNKGRFVDPPCVYSRYADDLTFSCRTEATVQLLLEEVPKIVAAHGFKINPSKTKVQCAKAGRRIITGVAVDASGCYVPREIRRRIRAGDHQAKVGMKRRAIRRLLFNSRKWKRHLPLRLRMELQLKGLKEWALLKLPREARQPKQGAVMAAVTHAVSAVCHFGPVQKLTGYFGRKFSL
jgi:hypothetical protein